MFKSTKIFESDMADFAGCFSLLDQTSFGGGGGGSNEGNEGKQGNQRFFGPRTQDTIINLQHEKWTCCSAPSLSSIFFVSHVCF